MSNTVTTPELKKTKEQILAELKASTMPLKDEISETHLHFVWATEFYQRYPEYQELNAASIPLIRSLIKINNKPIKVHRFTNGSIWFVGDAFNGKDVPIASIGDWQTAGGWEQDLKNCSEKIGEITWEF